MESESSEWGTDFNAHDGRDFEDMDTEKIAIPGVIDSNSYKHGKIRILVIGRTGAGKSTICNAVLNLPNDLTEVSHHKPGVHDIWKPLVGRDVILHDSGGLEAIDKVALAKVQEFISIKTTMPNVEDQLHCIWYCISAVEPRPLQESEHFFFDTILPRLQDRKLIVVAVFTKFDVAVDQEYGKRLKFYSNKNPDNPREEARKTVLDTYEEFYERPLKTKLGPNGQCVQIIRTAVPDLTESGMSR
ncbi:hypothetical protein ABW20_dc0103445 [Dactylellina cionopaga]|nr:hypothetical protein ABW20_dc0103445 [Dactylellina cionopaga]